MKKIIVLIFTIFFSFLSVGAEIVKLPSELGKVLEVEYHEINDSVAQVKQVATVGVMSGPEKGEIITLENVLTGNPYYDINLKTGSKVILHVEEDEDEGTITFYLESLYRFDVIIWLSLLFAGLLIYVGKKKGLYSLVSIAITCVLIFYVLSPLILAGVSPVLAVVLISLLATAVTMYLVGGFNRKSTSATLGCTLSLIVAGLLAFIVVKAASLTGFNNEETMYLYVAHPELNFIGVSIATMILATLGAVMDVGMSIASTINEIYELDNTKTIKELFVSGMNVGRDIIGTMANTLILVYLGGSLPLLLLASNIDFQKFVNLNQVVTEVSSALIGSIAIVICVPITAFVASRYLKKESIDINLPHINV